MRGLLNFQLKRGIRVGLTYVAGTLAKHKDGALYLLVTDQGYLREPGVVWERLSGIDGDTQFFKA